MYHQAAPHVAPTTTSTTTNKSANSTTTINSTLLDDAYRTNHSRAHSISGTHGYSGVGIESQPISWSSSVLAAASTSSNYPIHAYATHQAQFDPTPFTASGLMFGTSQTANYRSSFVVNSQHQEGGFNPLANSSYQPRAVDVSQSNHVPLSQPQWFQSTGRQTNLKEDGVFQGFSTYQTPSTMSTYYGESTSFTPATKELQLPQTYLVQPTSFITLPTLPVFVEGTSFSLSKQAVQPQTMWQALRDQLAKVRVTVAEDDQPFQLTCSSTLGVSCCEFKVFCYGQTHSNQYTVEFQRRSGCGVGFMQLFRHIVTALTTQFKDARIVTRLTAATPLLPPSLDIGLGSGSDEDMSDLDISALSMPSLSRQGNGSNASTAPVSPTSSTNSITADTSLYDSLLDLISSSDVQSQLSGMQSLALCLDGSHPRAPTLLREVALKLQTGEKQQVKQVAAKLLEMASVMPSASATVITQCLPILLSQLSAAPSNNSTCCTGPLDKTFFAQTQKSLLRTTLGLSTAHAKTFHSTFDGSVSPIQSSRFKRELLRMTASTDEEVRGLALETMKAIQV